MTDMHSQTRGTIGEPRRVPADVMLVNSHVAALKPGYTVVIDHASGKTSGRVTNVAGDSITVGTTSIQKATITAVQATP